jgi:hypothetical protein
MSTGEIDDTQSPVTETDPGADKNTSIVWPPMYEGLIHAVDNITRKIGPALVLKDAANSAHWKFA